MNFAVSGIPYIRGKVVIRNDSAVNISKEMYLEFVQPYDERILKEFGSGSIHYCGRGDQWIFEMMETEGMEVMNFGHPPNLIFGFEFLNEIYPKLKEKKIGVATYQLKDGKWKEIKSSLFKTGVTFSASADSRAMAAQILSEYNNC